MSRHDTPHDGSAVLGTVGGRSYKCTRGNCGAPIGHPVNQDAHNAAAHNKYNDPLHYEPPAGEDQGQALTPYMSKGKTASPIKPNAEGHGWLHGDW